MTAVISAPASEVIGHRYARRAQGGEHIGHLLTRSWEHVARRGRPALCGATAQKWRPVELFDDPGKFRDCPECSAAAGLTAPRTAPVRIAPAAAAPRGLPVDVAPVVAAAQPTQADRTRARARFRRSFRLADEARGYVPLDNEAGAAFAATRGVADGWPIPLTACSPKTPEN